MIPITMKSKGPLNQNTILSINNTRTQNTLTAQNLSILNKPAAQRSAYTAPTIDVSPHPHTQTQAAAASGTSSPAQPAARRTAPASAANKTAQPAARRTAPASAANKAAQPAARHTAPASAPAAAPPLQLKQPPLFKPVQKGQKAPLSAGSSSPGILKACFGWNTSNAQCDADVSAFLLGADGRVIGDSWFIFYGQTESPDKSCRFETSHAADREVITVNFQKLNTNVKKIVFVLTINEAFAKRLHFGMIKDAYIRILDEQGTERVSFPMAEYYSNVISMMIGEIYQYNGSWKFNAVGNGVAKDLAGLCALYGVEVSD